MPQKMEAEILFDDQNAADAGSAVLATHGFTIERLPWVDVYEGVVLTPTVWIKARIDSELDDSDFFNWVTGIIEPLQGWLYEAGLADPLPGA